MRHMPEERWPNSGVFVGQGTSEAGRVGVGRQGDITRAGAGPGKGEKEGFVWMLCLSWGAGEELPGRGGGEEHAGRRNSILEGTEVGKPGQWTPAPHSE